MAGKEEQKTGWGGYRPGSGRKPIGDRAGVCITFRVPQEVRDEIRALVRRQGIPSAVFLIEALRLMKERGRLPSGVGVGESEVEGDAELSDAVVSSGTDAPGAGQGREGGAG